jgi:hypothetical protein
MPDTPPQEPSSEPESSPPHASPGPGSADSDTYREKLSRADRALYDRISGDPDLTREIKILRLIITKLSRELEQQEITIQQALAVLCRCVSLQLKTGKHAAELEKLLLDAADDVLTAIETGVQ